MFVVNVRHMVASGCLVLERMATGVGAAARREAARHTGVLAALVDLARRWPVERDADCHASCRSALRSLTRDSGNLQDAARAAGADAGWLV